MGGGCGGGGKVCWAKVSYNNGYSCALTKEFVLTLPVKFCES